jgi:hypothetical protein
MEQWIEYLPSAQPEVECQQYFLSLTQVEVDDKLNRRYEYGHIQNQVEGRIEEAENAEIDACAHGCLVPQCLKRATLQATNKDNCDSIKTIDQTEEVNPVLEVLLREDGDVQGENTPLDKCGGHAIEDRIQNIKLAESRICQLSK